jgi:hypothetical protein
MITQHYSECGPKTTALLIDDDDDKINNQNKIIIIMKYKDITIEIQRMWNVKEKVILVIIGETGTISKSLTQYLSNIPGNYKIKELQKIAILGAAPYYGKC